MARTLKNSGIAAQIAWVLAVDDDGAMKGWTTPGAAAAWGAGSGLTLVGGGSAPSVVAGTWNGVSRNLIRCPATGAITIDAAIGVSAPFCFFMVVRNSTISAASVYYIAQAASSAGGAIDSAKPVIPVTAGPTIKLLVTDGSYALSQLAHNFSGAESFSMFLVNNASGDNPSYFSAEGGTITAADAVRAGYGTPMSDVFWKYLLPSNSPDGDIVAIGCLRVAPSIAEAQSINADPITALFDAGAATPIITGPTGAAGASSITISALEMQGAVGTWTATDSVSWSLTGTDAAALSITGGVVSKASGSFDYEAKTSYSFNVVNGSASQAVTLNITNVVEISTPTKSTPTATSIITGFTTDIASGEARAVYIAATSPPTAPSASQVKAGQNAAGSTSGVVAPTPKTVTTGTNSFASAAVTSGLTYYGFIVHTANGIDSNVLATGPVYPGTGRPTADVGAAGGWAASSGSDLFAMLNEDTADDENYITTPELTGSYQTKDFALDKPFLAGTYNNLRIRARVPTGAATGRVRLLDAGGASLAVSADHTLTGTWTTFTTASVTLADTATHFRIEFKTP